MVRWLKEKKEKGELSKGLLTRVVDELPSIFDSSTHNANLTKAASCCWWSKALIAEGAAGTRETAKRVGTMALVLRTLSKRDGPYNAKSVGDKGALIEDKINSRWIQAFMENHQIVLQAQTGKRQVSAEKRRFIEQQVATHLSELQRDFQSGALNEDTIENVGKTHFVIDFDNGKSLSFVKEKQIKYSDVESDGEGMAMVVRISGGASPRILPPMMIFMNQESSYPIRGVLDSTPGACYRSGRKDWMDKRISVSIWGEWRAMTSDRHGQEKTIFLDNCSSRLTEEECHDELKAMKGRLKFFSANATDLCQPADSFVIAKIKHVWNQKWNVKKIELVEGDKWQNTPRKDGTWSG